MIKSGSFTFNGKSSEDFGLVIQTPPVYTFPERDITVTHIPGRSGDITIDNKSYKNVKRAYSIALQYSSDKGYYDEFEKVLDWLNSANGSYATLEDTYDTKVYRKATFHLSGSFTDYYSKAGAIAIEFDCKPQRYLKAGDVETAFTGSTAVINSEYDYVSLPTIKIEGIDTESVANLDKVLMMSVYGENSASSERTNITFQKYAGNVTINSEEQTVTSDDGRDIYGNINLNGTPFPRFRIGDNKIEFKKYQLELARFNSYANKLNTYQKSVSSEYKIYSAIQQLEQQSFFVKTYDMLLTAKQEGYLASSAQSLIDSKCESYTFASFNDLMGTYGSSFSFTGTAEDNYGSIPDWVSLKDENGAVVATALKSGFYRIDTVDKKIRFIPQNGIISNELKTGSVNVILYYEATDDSTDINNAKLKVGYTDVPDWLTYEIIYDRRNGNCHPTKVTYKISKTAVGYYWTDKTWIFGKASWGYINGSDKDIDLASVSWSTSKKAFTILSGLSLSTTSTFTYKFYGNKEGMIGPRNMPEYEPIVKETVDDNGVKHTTVTNAVHFRIETDETLSKITLKAKDDGMYKVLPDKGAGVDRWVFRSKDSNITTTPIDGKVAFEVLYMGTNPDYSNETTKEAKWPAWMEPKPYVKTKEGGIVELSPIDYSEGSTIVFKITSPGWYRLSEGTADDTPKAMDDFIRYTQEQIDTGTYTDKILEKVKGKTSDGHYFFRLEKETLKPANNRVFMYRDEGSNESTMHENPPDWLLLDYMPEDVTKDLKIQNGGYIGRNGEYIEPADKNLKCAYTDYYSVSQDYLYTVSGISKEDSVLLALYNENKGFLNMFSISSGGTLSTNQIDAVMKDVKFFRISTIDRENFPIKITRQQKEGTPDRVSYKANVANGYYRFDSNTTWQKYTKGSEIIQSGGKTDTVIYFLPTIPEVEIEEPAFADYLTIEIIQDRVTSNPVEIKFLAKQAGYYRYNNYVDWKYYNVGEELFTSKINEDSIVYHLKAENDNLTNLKIKVKPRWWVL